MGVAMSKQKLIEAMFQKMNDAVFFLKRNEVLYMNPKAMELISKFEVDLFNMPSICHVCNGMTNEKGYQTCSSCFIEGDKNLESFQLFLAKKNDANSGDIPFSGSYFLLDELEEVNVLVLRNLTNQQETEKLQYQKSLTEYVIHASEEERKRLSRELHDGLAQEIYSALIQLQSMRYTPDFDKVKETASKVETIIVKSLNSIKSMAIDLRPAALDDMGLYAALKSYCKRYEETFGMEVELYSNIQSERFDGNIETMVYRVCTEALINAAKHADVEQVVVYLLAGKKQLRVEVMDEGVGFDLHNIHVKGSGLGLRNMEERISLLGGKVSIETSIGIGTKVLAVIPLEQEDNND
ncbi:sensor histidine kinase [Niallia taxi]|uniref:sensor histidine kinase n=1 Tax=Niallia taxi TaxID=2499688 RepID=UPI00300A37A5